MKTIGILAFALVAALVLGLGTRMGTETAYADATDIQLIGCELLAGGADGDLTDATVAGDYTLAGCDGTAISTTVIDALDDTYGDGDGTLEASDLEDRDALDGNQIGENCTAVAPQCTLLAFVYVDDEAAVTIDPPAGLQTTEGGTIDFVCDTEAEDADCADVVPNDGDGVVVFHILNDTADSGDTLTVNAEQETEEVSADVNVVGVADDVEITLAETVIQASGSTSDVNDCVTDFDVEDDLGEPNATVAIVVVVDNDGEPLARQTADITSDDDDIATVGTGTPDEAVGNTGQTVVVDVGTAQYAIICGGTDTGDVDIVAEISPASGDEDASATLTVVGEPDAIALAAAPAQIACDGTATSTVTATVTDSEGNNVANGTEVRFDVVALGTANPITVTTTDGVASSVITPLSAATAGVTVIVSAGDAEASTRVDCSLPIPPTTGPGPVATPTRTGIVGPDTGNGGYLGQDSSAGFPTWTLVALALGSVALVAGGMVTRKVSK